MHRQQNFQRQARREHRDAIPRDRLLSNREALEEMLREAAENTRRLQDASTE